MEYLKYPKLDVKFLWSCGYWDGPLSGILEYQNQRYWFQECDDFINHPDMVAKWNDDERYDEVEWSRRYTVHELTSAELAEEEEQHESFRTHVGTHTDYDKDGNRPGTVHNNTNHQEFDDKYKNRKPRDYKTNKIIGWFER